MGEHHCFHRRPARTDRANEQLALRADVEEAGAERDRDREPGENERDRSDDRLGDVVRRAEGALDQCAVRRDRVVAREEDEDAAEHQRDGDGKEREGRPPSPLERELTH